MQQSLSAGVGIYCIVYVLVTSLQATDYLPTYILFQNPSFFYVEPPNFGIVSQANQVGERSSENHSAH